MSGQDAAGAFGVDGVATATALNHVVAGTTGAKANVTAGRSTGQLITGTDGLPVAQGMFDPAGTRDACGVGFVAHMKGVKSHQIVRDALQVLENLEHRGAAGADPLMGDGAGILVQIPHDFFAAEAAKLGFTLPSPGTYGIGMMMLSTDAEERTRAIELTERAAKAEGLTVLGWRTVPVDNSSLSDGVRATEPVIAQVFLGAREPVTDGDAFERRLYIVRKVVSGDIYEADWNGATKRSQNIFYCVSMSARTVVYKGMFLAFQLAAYYPDLSDERFVSAIALVHQRFSTNTFPSWKLAHPYRMVAHNGEINTLRGNMNWMYARQATTTSKLFGNEIEKMWPISYEGQSDTACFDNALEFLVQGGYSLPHAVMTLIPEAWSENKSMDPDRKAFYEYHAAIMEPWDGPAAVCFTDGRSIGATLDRNGLRPARYVITDDDRIVLASESGVLPIPEEKIVQKLRLQPGKMLLIDLEAGRIVSDEEIKAQMAKAHPYADWIRETQLVIEDLPEVPAQAPKALDSLLDLQQAFGYTQEDLKLLLAPMAVTGQEAVGSMGTDTPISALSNKPKLLYTYFKQNFAQVTNPPIDPIREELVMSLVSFIGPRPNLFDHADDAEQKRLEVRQPILTNEDLEKIRAIEKIATAGFRSITIDVTYPAANGHSGMRPALDAICAQAEAAVRVFATGQVYNIIVLSDRSIGRERIAIPALLATAAVHHHLIRKGLRTRAGLVVETGEAREIHHFALLAGYGAEAINPYLAFDTILAMKGQFPATVDAHEIVHRYIKSIGKGLLKVMSKMGISTYQSYCGAQIFDAVGLASDLVKEYFFGTASQIEGVGLTQIAQETVKRHKEAFGDDPVLRNSLDVGGEYNFRLRGEAHAWSPELVASLQHAVRMNEGERTTSYAKYKSEFADVVNNQSDQLLTIRGLFAIKTAAELGRTPVDLAEVEPAADIVKRFATGAMSFGSISREAHTTLAIAMNRIGGRSNTGEGGEEADRFKRLPNGDSLRSAIKQVASGRFGVTTDYLVNADQMQIKVAQGAKPGEGGQLPGHKVDAVIAKVRHSTPGVGLISPPPHHDIYSIEDLAQLIFDLKNVNPDAEVSVKLVSEVGVGTVAAGVAKARADHITISGFEGGTGASPLTSLKHAGSPWEIGLAETQQTLVINGLRSRVRLQVDGGLKTGRDVIIGALLGADEFGFSTAPLIAAGCLMMRKCHLNTCPVGIATQDPVLRKRFKGTPEHVINYFFFIAEEVRELMAAMGVRKFEELVGRADLLAEVPTNEHWKARGLDFAKLFHMPSTDEMAIRHTSHQTHPIADVLDRKLIAAAEKALEQRQRVKIIETVKNVDRSVGAMLSGQIAKRYGHAGLAQDTIRVELTGTAGQAFGAFAARGLTLDLIGDANDYVGKGLSGGRIIVRPNPKSQIKPEASIIVGNTVLYGAVEGECYFRGLAGERFAVRNSGAVAVVEGCGDHGCEYMTGGLVVVLGPTGRNFGAGMSGGVAYVLDEEGTFRSRVNMAMVDLEPVPEEEELLEALHHHGGDLEFKGRVDTDADMTRHDNERLYQLIQSHFQHTGSTRAEEILDNWEVFRPKFVKVMPVEYKKALEAMKADRYSAAAE